MNKPSSFRCETRTVVVIKYLLGLILFVVLWGLSRTTRAATLSDFSQATQAQQLTSYYPARDSWESRKPADVGMDDQLLHQAVEWARAHETNRPKDLSDQVRS